MRSSPQLVRLRTPGLSGSAPAAPSSRNLRSAMSSSDLQLRPLAITVTPGSRTPARYTHAATFPSRSREAVRWHAVMRGQDQPSRADFGTFDAQWDVFSLLAVVASSHEPRPSPRLLVVCHRLALHAASDGLIWPMVGYASIA